jgi:hypothetical protein
MKRRTAESTDILIPLFLLLATSEFIFIYHAGIQTNRENHKSNCKEHAKSPHPIPTSYSQINIRINNLDTVSSRSSSKLDGDDLTITVDSNGITVTNRGQWMYDKWDTQNKKKVYPNIYVTVNIKTKEILALENTDERAHDGKVMY